MTSQSRCFSLVARLSRTGLAWSRVFPAPVVAFFAVFALCIPQQADAHAYWPPKPTVKVLDPVYVKGTLNRWGPVDLDASKPLVPVRRLELGFRLKQPPKGGFFEQVNYSTMGLNWCHAKKTLPSGWDTQDDRALRTSSMCAGPPQYGGLGKDWSFKALEHNYWTTPKNYNFQDGRYIISFNGWVSGSHHAGGNHTSLWLFDIDVP